MTLKILAIADVHLGMKQETYPETVRQARLVAVNRAVDLANQQGCDLMLVAGDLFDSQSVGKRDVVLPTVEALAGFSGKMVAVLPGNHDFIGGSSKLWEWFCEAIENHNIMLLDQGKPLDLRQQGISAALYPAPCTAKTSAENGLGWFSTTDLVADVDHHIGVAHGSIEGLSEFDRRYFPMQPEELQGYGLDCWVIGHAHMPWSENGIFSPGTPEPDRPGCRHRGQALVITLSPREKISHETFDIGAYWFSEETEKVVSAGDLPKIAEKYQATQYKDCILSLTVTGRLASSDYQGLIELEKHVDGAVFHLRKFVSADVRRDVTVADIDKEFTTGSFPSQLLTALADDPDDAEALQVAYEIIREIKR